MKNVNTEPWISPALAASGRAGILASLDAGRVLELASIEVRWADGVLSILHAPSGAVLNCLPVDPQTLAVTGVSGRDVHPLIQPDSSRNADADAPLVRTGPGGDYVSDYHAEDLAGEAANPQSAIRSSTKSPQCQAGGRA